MVESLASKERNVYEHTIGIKIQDFKISAIDVHGKATMYDTHYCC